MDYFILGQQKYRPCKTRGQHLAKSNSDDIRSLKGSWWTQWQAHSLHNSYSSYQNASRKGIKVICCFCHFLLIASLAMRIHWITLSICKVLDMYCVDGNFTAVFIPISMKSMIIPILQMWKTEAERLAEGHPVRIIGKAKFKEGKSWLTAQPGITKFVSPGAGKQVCYSYDGPPPVQRVMDIVLYHVLPCWFGAIGFATI